MKTCSKCGQSKPFEHFHKSQRHCDGFFPWCKSCRREWSKAYNKKYHKEHQKEHRQYVEQNKERINQRRRKRRARDPERFRQQERNYYHENKGQLNARARKRRTENHEAIIQRERQYYKNLTQEQKDKIREQNKNCNRSDQGLIKQKKAKRAWCRNNPEKRAAQNTLNNAIRDGRLDKPEKCEECGRSAKKLNGHHEDYSQPLKVKWLCEICHSAKHKVI
jgi:hypothetical protein